MAFDVSKFLALTALIATTAASCSSTDSDPETSKGGSSGSGTAGDAGQSTQGGGNDGVGGAAAGNGGDAGDAGGAAAGAGGAALGGAEAGGAGGAGGAAEVGECLGALAEGGAGGAPAVEPSLEGLCMDYFDTVCAGSEDSAPSYTVCEGVKDRAQPGVAVAVEDCISKLSAADACDYAKVTACLTGLAGKGCANPNSATACANIKTNCDEVDVASCEKIADLVNPDLFEGFTGCMDPTDEGWYEPAFTGTCVERLDFCAGARNFWQF
jgi:hypothetical protein